MACQPSARMKTKTLAGSEMTVGGSIIMPMLISKDDTTKSMIMNGM